MLRWAIIFFVIAIVAAALGFGGIVPLAMEIAIVLAVIGVVLFIISAVSGKRLT